MIEVAVVELVQLVVCGNNVVFVEIADFDLNLRGKCEVAKLFCLETMFSNHSTTRSSMSSPEKSIVTS